MSDNKTNDAPSRETITLVLRKLAVVDKRIQDVRRLGPLGKGAVDLVNGLLSFVQALRARASQLSQQYEDALQSKNTYMLMSLEQRARTIGRAVTDIQSWLRYICAAAGQGAAAFSPINEAAEELMHRLTLRVVKSHAPENRPGVCIVRPQWKYNYKYVRLDEELRRRSNEVWMGHPPSEVAELCDAPIAVLSYAGLDADDALLLSGLAHEIAHHVDLTIILPIHSKQLEETFKQMSHRLLRGIQESIEKVLGQMPQAPWSLSIVTYQAQAMGRGLRIWLRELAADLIAVRLLGPAYYFAFAHCTDLLSEMHEPAEEYPPVSFRLREMKKEIDELGYKGFLEAESTKGERLWDNTDLGSFAAWRLSEIGNLAEEASPSVPEESAASMTLQDRLRKERATQLEKLIEEPLALIRETVRKRIPKDLAYTLKPGLFSLVRMMLRGAPPWPPFPTGAPDEPWPVLEDLLNAAWIHFCLPKDLQMSHCMESPTVRKCYNEDDAERWALFSRLTLKAIETCSWQKSQKPSTGISAGLSEPARVVSCGALPTRWVIERLRRWKDKDLESPLITPVATPLEEHADPISIDLRLGLRYAIARRSKAPRHEPKDQPEMWHQDYLASDELLTVHPGDLVLASTLEYVVIPANLYGMIYGKSSLARRGLQVEIAPKIDPGYRGNITLELANVGPFPVQVRPGEPIAQLLLLALAQPCTPEELYAGTWQFSTGPMGELKPSWLESAAGGPSSSQ